MKPFFCLVSLVLCVFCQQSGIAAPPSAYDEEPYRLTKTQQTLLDEIVDQIGFILREINSANSCDVPLDAPDPPLAQSFTDFLDEGLGGTLYLSNTEIDGLSKLLEQPEVTNNKMEIRVKTKLKELNIHGDYNIEGYNGEDESGTFSVVLSNVVVIGVVSLLQDPHGNVKINKVTPTILSEYSYVTMKTELVSHGSMLRSVHKHVENTIRNRLIRLATMEVLFQYPDIPDDGSLNEVKSLNRTLFEARKYVDYGYNPYKMKMMSMQGASSVWHMGPFNIHGFSNFFVDELDLMTNNNGTTIDVILRVIGKDLYGKFPLTLQQRNIGDYTVEKVEVIAKIVIPARFGLKSSPVRLQTVQMQMTHCVTHVRDRATGQSISDSEFGFDIEGLFCLLLKNDLSMQDIMNQIQTDILDRMDASKLKPKVDAVIQEDMNGYPGSGY